MRAIILAGGMGMRLRSVVSDVPKPMAPINNKPFLAYLLDYLHSQGITQVVFSLGYQAENIRDYFQSQYRSIKIDYAIETTALGTGGAMRYAMQSYADSTEPIFVFNGDTLFEADLQAMYHSHQQHHAMLTMALCQVDNVGRYGCVSVQETHVAAFREKGEPGAGLINAGVYLMASSLLKDYPEGAAFSFENDYLASGIIKPHAFVADGYFIDIGHPEDYLRAKGELV